MFAFPVLVVWGEELCNNSHKQSFFRYKWQLAILVYDHCIRTPVELIVERIGKAQSIQGIRDDLIAECPSELF